MFKTIKTFTMKNFIICINLIFITFVASAQETVTLTFTGETESHSFQQLDSVKIDNLTREWTEVVYYPDTLLILNTVGVPQWDRAGAAKLYQNTPNPFEGITLFNLVLPEQKKVQLAIYDLNGKKMTEYRHTLPAGEHQFRANLSSPQTYLLSAQTDHGTTSIKMVNVGKSDRSCHIDYLSSLPLTEEMTRKESSSTFASGDRMQYTGYATQTDGVKEAVITQNQHSSETILFTFPDEVQEPLLPLVQTLSVDRASSGSAQISSKAVPQDETPITEVGVIISTDTIFDENDLIFKGDTIDENGIFITEAYKLTKGFKYVKLYAKAYAINEVGTAYGNVLPFLLNNDFHCGDLLYDIEDNVYRTVKIGPNCWMAENMRSKTYADGKKLEPLTTDAEYTYGRYYYERTDSIVGHQVYYPWSTACNFSINQTDQNRPLQGICPDGWHVPSYKEWADMLNAIDPAWNRGTMATNISQYELPSSNKLAVKLANPDCHWVWYKGPGYTGDTMHSPTPNTLGYNYSNHIIDPDANASGFDAKPCGYWKNGDFFYNGAAQYWTDIGSTAGIGRTVKVAFSLTGIMHYSYEKTAREGYSVRCICGSGDDPSIPLYPELQNDSSFSMIFLSDPQAYNKSSLCQPLFELQTAWTALVRNRLNVIAALISGDMVEKNDSEHPYVDGHIHSSAQTQTDLRNGNQSSQQQWESVSRALERLDDVMPYVPCQGNHDCGPLAAEDRRSEMPKYFYPERNLLNEKHLVSLGTNYEGKQTMENSAFEFHTDTWGDLLVIGFEFAPRDEALNWARELIESDKYKNHRVIILTHSFLKDNGEQYTSESYTLQPRNWAKDVWNKLIFNSENIVMVLCGHSGSPPSIKSTVAATDYSCAVSFHTDTAANGRKIPQMMFNAQCADGSWHGNGGDGWLRILEFMPDGETISVRTFSPLFALSRITKSQAWRTKDYDQFTFKVPKLKIEN
jgi:uncharacterized protein (TIGR02145 family)